MCSKLLSMRFIIGLVALLLFRYGYSGLQKGKVLAKGGLVIDRQDSPFNFWASIVCYFAMSIFGMAFALFPEKIAQILSFLKH